MRSISIVRCQTTFPCFSFITLELLPTRKHVYSQSNFQWRSANSYVLSHQHMHNVHLTLFMCIKTKTKQIFCFNKIYNQTSTCSRTRNVNLCSHVFLQRTHSSSKYANFTLQHQNANWSEGSSRGSFLTAVGFAEISDFLDRYSTKC